jgi:hypothetical protein
MDPLVEKVPLISYHANTRAKQFVAGSRQMLSRRMIRFADGLRKTFFGTRLQVFYYSIEMLSGGKATPYPNILSQSWKLRHEQPKDTRPTIILQVTSDMNSESTLESIT